jgi:predicted mannosyl-3-phosphoglycerate phosphatase (HAD superfamily)
MVSKKAEVDERLDEITQNIRSVANHDKASSARTASKETIERMNGSATEAQPKARTPETKEMVITLGVMETTTFIFKWRQKPFRNVSKWEAVASTLRR